MKLFSGTGNPKLSSKIADLLKTKLAKAEVVRFDNSEVRVRIEEDVRDQTAVVIQSTSNPTDTHLVELFFFCDALKRSGTDKIIGIIPYFGYARQNIQHRPGEDVSANVVVKFLETVGFDEILVIDLHDEATEGIFSIPFRNISALPLLAEKIKKILGEESVVIVTPDQGGAERARRFANAYFGNKDNEIVIVEKKRNLEKIHESVALDLHGDVKDKTAIIVDDIVTSGGTLINAANLCRAKGAKKVIAAVTHHDFSSSAPEKIQNSNIESFLTTNTITLRDDQKFPKLQEISIAPLITEELRNYSS